MPECRDCGTFVATAGRCQTCRLEHQHGTLEDRRDQRTCPACGTPVPAGAPTTSIDGETAHAECKGQVRCDGGSDLCEWALGHIVQQVNSEADGPQDNSLWTSEARLKAEASKVDFVSRAEASRLIDRLESRGDVVYWHGLIAPATEKHIDEILESEEQAEFPRSTLIGRLKHTRAATAGGED